MSLGLLILLCLLGSSYAQVPGGLRPAEILAFLRRGGVLAYDVDVSKCDVKMPPNIPAYSFGDVITDVYMEFDSLTEWRLFTTEERPVNGSHYQLQTSVVRVTELEVTPSGLGDATGLITISDIQEGQNPVVLGSGNITCKISTGGLVILGQQFGGRELEVEEEVEFFLHRGLEVTFSVDITACTKTLPGGVVVQTPHIRSKDDDPVEVWASRVTGYRIPHSMNQTIEFTSVLRGSKQLEVFNVRVEREGNQVEVKSYVLPRPGQQPNPVVLYTCKLGASGAFHIYGV